MAPLTPQHLISPIAAMIDKAHEDAAESWRSYGFSPSDLGTDCARYLWLKLHWAAPMEQFSGRMLRLFRRGHHEEYWFVDDLKRIGVDVQDVDPATQKQWAVRALGGHLRGKLDAIAFSGVPGAPAKAHVVEFKTHSSKSFGKLQALGVQRAKPEHYLQMTTYMGLRCIDRALYGAVNKDNDTLHYERVSFDEPLFNGLMLRFENVLHMARPPEPLAPKRNAPPCMFCKVKGVCSGTQWPELNCRTCLHSSPTMAGNAAWHCSRHAKPLSYAEQKEGCPNHLFVPEIVPGEQIDVDEHKEVVIYRLTDGSIWVDGESPTPISEHQLIDQEEE